MTILSPIRAASLPLLFAPVLLCACGNKGELLQPSQVPPEDAGRYLIPPKPEPQPASAAPAQQQPFDDDDDAL